MLVLARYLEESIFLDVAGIRIEVKVIELNNTTVRLGINAPPEVRIVRDNAKITEPKPRPAKSAEVPEDELGQAVLNPDQDTQT